MILYGADMQSKSQKLMGFFRKHGGVVRFSAVLEAGFHPDSLGALAKDHKIERIAWGLYRLSDYDMGANPDLIAASLQAPRGVICLLSALAFHEATTEIPKYVDIAIPQGAHANRVKYPPIRFYHFDRRTWPAGIEKHKIGNHTVRVYSLARTIADCFKFRNKVGINIAREALKDAVAEKKVMPKEIMQYARICRVDRIIKPIMEAIL